MKRILVTVLSLVLVYSMAGESLAGLTDGLVAYYPFNGNTTDKSGNTHNGNIITGSLTTDRFANSNYAFSGYLEVPDNDSLDFQNAFTISAWLKVDAITHAFNCWIGKNYTTSYAVGIDSDKSGECPAPSNVNRHMRVYIGNTVTYFTDGPSFSCGTNEWNHVAVTFDDAADTLQLFVNGTLVDSKTNTGHLSNSDSVLGIGRDGTWGDTFTGSIDDLMLYNRVLTRTEIQQLYNPNLAVDFPDSDGDGVIDPIDTCSNTPADSYVDKNGCPAQGLYTEAQMNQMVQSILQWGDINGDTKIDLSEAIHALRVSSGVTTPAIQ